MKILLTAKNSFVSRPLYPFLLECGYEVDAFSHQELDLTDINALRPVLDNGDYDFVINPAIAGQGRILKEDSLDDFYNNLLMNENLLFLKDAYGKLITFSSGAGNNRQQDIINLREHEVTIPPRNRYSLAKYICNRRIEHLPNVTNLRIFNLFGPLERQDRFISTAIRNYINKKDIEIWGDAYFDFFGINDFLTVIRHILSFADNNYSELNLVYKEKTTLSLIAGIINGRDEHKVNIKIVPGINKHYYGSGFKLSRIGLPFLGLEKEIENMYQHLMNEKNN